MVDGKLEYKNIRVILECTYKDDIVIGSPNKFDWRAISMNGQNFMQKTEWKSSVLSALIAMSVMMYGEQNGLMTFHIQNFKDFDYWLIKKEYNRASDYLNVRCDNMFLDEAVYYRELQE